MNFISSLLSRIVALLLALAVIALLFFWNYDRSHGSEHQSCRNIQRIAFVSAAARDAGVSHHAMNNMIGNLSSSAAQIGYQAVAAVVYATKIPLFDVYPKSDMLCFAAL